MTVKSVVTAKRNGELIAAAASLWINDGDLVLDSTYGRGLFWTQWVARDRPVPSSNDMPVRRREPVSQDEETLWLVGRGLGNLHLPVMNFIRHDLYTLDKVDFRDLPEKSGSIDVVVFDPPYVSTGGITTTTVPDFRARYGMDNAKRTMAHVRHDIGIGMAEATRVLMPKGRLMVKCMDYVESGKFQQGHKFVLDVADMLHLVQVDEFLHVSGTGPQPLKNRNGSPRRQVHARKAHSFLCVFAKR